jgi:hypothetical protein
VYVFSADRYTLRATCMLMVLAPLADAKKKV